MGVESPWDAAGSESAPRQGRADLQLVRKRCGASGLMFSMLPMGISTVAPTLYIARWVAITGSRGARGWPPGGGFLASKVDARGRGRSPIPTIW